MGWGVVGVIAIYQQLRIGAAAQIGGPAEGIEEAWRL